ncbi:MAG: WhiB family transcriptional regulator [Acidimicrobiia bacterium]
MALTWVRTHDWDLGAWRNQSACRDTDPELFFPIGTTGTAIEQIEVAKGICARCDVRPECLEFAFETAQESGVWGGLTEDERRALKKELDAERRAG